MAGAVLSGARALTGQQRPDWGAGIRLVELGLAELGLAALELADAKLVNVGLAKIA